MNDTLCSQLQSYICCWHTVRSRDSDLHFGVCVLRCVHNTHTCLILSIRRIQMSMWANVIHSHNHMKFKISAILKILVCFFAIHSIAVYITMNIHFFLTRMHLSFSSEIIKKQPLNTQNNIDMYFMCVSICVREQTTTYKMNWALISKSYDFFID